MSGFFRALNCKWSSSPPPGAGRSAEDVEKALVVPLENALRNVPNLEKMSSSSRDGSAGIYLEFPESADLERASEDVRRYLDQAVLPDGAETPEARKFVRYDDLMRISLLGGDLGELRRTTRRLENELTRLGVARVEINGLPREEIQVALDRRRLVELNATARDIGRMIAAHNRDISAGDANLGESESRLRALAKRADLFGLAEVPAVADADGRMLRLGDVADIRRVVPDGEKTLEVNGRQAVGTPTAAAGTRQHIGFGAGGFGMGRQRPRRTSPRNGIVDSRRAMAAS